MTLIIQWAQTHYKTHNFVRLTTKKAAVNALIHSGLSIEHL